MSSQQTRWHIEGGKRDHDYEIWREDWHLFTIVDAGTCSDPMKNAKLVGAAPAMRDALLAVRDDYQELLRVATSNDEADEIDSMLTIVNEALATADCESAVRFRKHEVWIRWGSGEAEHTKHYEFDTLAELNAFVTGIDEADGWLNWEQFDEDPGLSQDEEDEREFDITYRCPECKHEWHEVWSSACDSECPKCHEGSISPVAYVSLPD